MRFAVSNCSPILSQYVLQSQCQYFLFSSLRGCAKAGESVLVHGASGGVSIPRRQVAENAALCPCICFFLGYELWWYFYQWISRLGFYFRYSRMLLVRTSPVILNNCETARVLG